MKTLKDKVKSTINKFSLISPGDKVICAVSGGPDSVTMLHILSDLSQELNFSLVCAYFNHKLRKESEREEQFVQELSESLNIPFYKGEKDIKKLSKGKNIEKVAREERYRFLENLRKTLKAQSIATGHTASDLVETVIFNLTKGSGIKGLRGFLPKRDHIIRPLFETTREEVENYLTERKLPYCIDSSNFSIKFSRNLIRLKVIPLLREVNPSLEKTFLKTTSNIRELEDFIKSEVEKTLSFFTFEKEKTFVELAVIKNTHPFILKEVIQEAFKKLSKESLNSEKLKAVESIIKKSGFKRLNLKNGYVCYKNQTHFIIEKETTKKRKEEKTYIKTIPLEVETPIGKIIFSKDSKDAEFSFPEKELEKELFIKYRKGGEWLHLPYGKKKLKKFLIEKKIPAQIRDKIPLLSTKENEIIWIPKLYKKTYINENNSNLIFVRIEGDFENVNF